jgi:hypothetical protein
VILEGIVTTLDPDGAVHIAPMGPTVDDSPALTRFVLRPFPTAQTYRNLRLNGEGVLHVTDDVLLLARAAVGLVSPPPLAPACRVRGFVLRDACRYYEFRVCTIDEGEPRVRIKAEVVHTARQRDFFGFNRAKHAIVEAAILASRSHLLPMPEIEAEYRKLAIIVNKTGGSQEREAFEFLESHLAQWRATREVAIPGPHS